MPANDISFSPVAGVSGEDAQYLGSLIRTVPGFPSEGILFRDFMPVFADPRGMRILVDALVSSLPVPADDFDYIAGLEARGFLLGTILAQRLGKGFIAVRKAGKLPPPVISQSYTLEYGEATMEVEKGLVRPGSKVLITDDLVATGGTAWAAMKLFESSKCTVAGFSFVMKLDGLDGYDRIAGYPVSALFSMPA